MTAAQNAALDPEECMFITFSNYVRLNLLFVYISHTNLSLSLGIPMTNVSISKQEQAVDFLAHITPHHPRCLHALLNLDSLLTHSLYLLSMFNFHCLSFKIKVFPFMKVF